MSSKITLESLVQEEYNAVMNLMKEMENQENKNNPSSDICYGILYRPTTETWKILERHGSVCDHKLEVIFSRENGNLKANILDKNKYYYIYHPWEKEGRIGDEYH